MRVRSLDQEGPLEESVAAHASVLPWRIPWTEEPGGLQSLGLQSWTRLNQRSKRQLTKQLKPPSFL